MSVVDEHRELVNKYIYNESRESTKNGSELFCL
jgi:hypothetical protein